MSTELFNTLSQYSDKHLILIFPTVLLLDHSNERNDHQLSNVLIFNHILPTSNGTDNGCYRKKKKHTIDCRYRKTFFVCLLWLNLLKNKI